jgi:hypothetical protein
LAASRTIKANQAASTTATTDVIAEAAGHFGWLDWESVAFDMVAPVHI